MNATMTPAAITETPISRMAAERMNSDMFPPFSKVATKAPGTAEAACVFTGLSGTIYFVALNEA